MKWFWRLEYPSLCLSVAVILLVGLLAGCSSDDDPEPLPTQSVTGSVTVSISDPPTCKGPLAPADLRFDNMWVTVTRVRAHLSGNAVSGDNGWVEVVDLRESPMQIDLLDVDDASCILETLGSTTGLPAGNYQQIRIHLLSNSPDAGEATPSPNNCETATEGGFNCAQITGGELKTLRLGSQAQTGLKVPPGRIAGGALNLEAGQPADINIEFDACNSVVAQGDGRLRLLPTLHAGEVSVATETLSGRVVDDTGNPIPDATIMVLVEQLDESGIDRVIMQTLASSTDGTFTICPLPAGDYEVVVAATAAGVTYGPTITFTVPVGSDLGDIPVAPVTGMDATPAQIGGVITTSDMTGNATGSDIVVRALQEVGQNGSTVLVTIPLLADSTPNLATEDSTLTLICPMGTKCAAYTLFVPPLNPMVGTFDSTGTTYSMPAAPPVLYQVNARAFIPGSGSLPNCMEPNLLTTVDDAGNPLEVMPGATVTAETLGFTGCEASF